MTKHSSDGSGRSSTRESSQPSEPAGATGGLSTWLADLDLAQVPDTVVERARHLFLDGIGCALVGARLPWSCVATNAILGLESPGDATVIGWEQKIAAPAAALLNGTFIQSFELDDFHPLGPLHGESVVIPSLLATAEHLKETDGRRLLTAAIAGLEVGPRVGMALAGVQILTAGWHSGAVFGTLAAAAAAGLVHRLDAGAFEDALGIAATQSGGLMSAQFGSMVKRMQHGFAARNGVYAAALAAGGYVGIKRVIEQPYGGYLSTFGRGLTTDESMVTRGLGKDWEILRVTVKPYPACGLFHAAIDGALEICAGRSFAASDVESIEVTVGRSVFTRGAWRLERPVTPLGAQMNLAYAVAVAILDREVGLLQFTPERIARDDFWPLLDRTSIICDETIDELPPEERLRTTLRIRLREGPALEAHVPEPLGGSGRPLTNEDVRAKYRKLAGMVADPERIAALEERVLQLDRISDASELTRALGAAVREAFADPATK